MSTRPQVSVVVPVYNLEFYIERCLKSLAAQTIERLEVLVIDDGSTDDSPTVVSETVGNDTRFKVTRKTNGGHGSACNLGIEQATGEFVMIVDGDDFLDPDTCAAMYALALEHDADLLMGNLKYFHGGGQTSVFRPIEIDTGRRLDANDREKLFNAWATPCGRLYRRAIFDDPAVRFLPGIIYADVNFAPKTFYAAKHIHYVNREFYNYDITRPTQSIKQSDRKLLDVVPSLRDMLRFYKAKGAFDAQRKSLLDYTLRHVIAWSGRVRTLQGYPRGDAFRDLFGTLDEFFGDEWTKGPLEREVGRRRAFMVRSARRAGYAPLEWTWIMRDRVMSVEEPMEKLLLLPHRAYRKLKRHVKEELLDRLTY